MTIIIKFNQRRKEVWHVVALQELISDFKHILAMQLKELINEIEDCEDEAASVGTVRAVQFLDDCYLVA
jgi:hypothetical protein